MRISILIVTRNWNPECHDYEYIKQLNDTGIDFEILIAEGNNPSIQRNFLAQNAKGDFLLFLDDDSVPMLNVLERYRNTLLNYPEIEVVGGPSILKNDSSVIFGMSELFFSSHFGIGPVINRYNSNGNVRNASEKELILCNLLVRREFFLKTNGFNQNLYPGEENQFLKKIQSSTRIMYDPRAIVYRAPREHMHQFLKQMYTYGKGRAKHLSLNSFYEYIFLIPLAFSLYVLILPFARTRLFISFMPAFLHVGLSILTLMRTKKRTLTFAQKAFVPVFIFSGHFCYGLGLMNGLLRYTFLKKIILPTKKLTNVKIHNLKNFKKITN